MIIECHSSTVVVHTLYIFCENPPFGILYITFFWSLLPLGWAPSLEF